MLKKLEHKLRLLDEDTYLKYASLKLKVLLSRPGLAVRVLMGKPLLYKINVKGGIDLEPKTSTAMVGGIILNTCPQKSKCKGRINNCVNIPNDATFLMGPSGLKTDAREVE